MRSSRAVRRWPAVALAAVLGASILGGCSSSKAADGGAKTSTAASVELPTPPAVTPVAAGLPEEQALAALRARPLWLPTLPSGAACPTSESRPLPGPLIGEAYGGGPLYLLADTARPEAVVTVGERRAAKAIWQIAPGRPGPLLVRGYQLNGRGALTFDEGAPDLPIARDGAPGGPGAAAGWRDRPSLMVASEDGCYALQVDGPDFTSVIVIEVRFNVAVAAERALNAAHRGPVCLGTMSRALSSQFSSSR